jgi:hypothetical protein
VSKDINVLVLVKGEEKYLFLYDDASRAKALQALGRYAANPQLSFNWHDAAVLGQQVRRAAQTATLDLPSPRFEYPVVDDPLG